MTYLELTWAGDAEFVAPVIELADYHQHYPSNTYLYSFNYQSRKDSHGRWRGSGDVMFCTR